MERIAIDTTFLIDLQRDRRPRGKPSGAVAFLRANPNTELFLPAVALGEYMEGFDDVTSEAARALVDPLKILETTKEVALLYAATARALRTSGRMIGANDLWIGSTARAFDLPLATRNADHFSRIPELAVIEYSA